MVLFVGLLWLIGVACDERRRDYVTEISKLVMGKAHALLGLPPEVYVPVLPAMQGQMHDEIGQAVLTAKRPDLCRGCWFVLICPIRVGCGRKLWRKDRCVLAGRMAWFT